MIQGCGLLSENNDGADSARSRHERDGQRYDGDVLLFHSFGLFSASCLYGTWSGVKHGDGHNYQEETACHTEGTDGNSKDLKDAVSKDQTSYEDDRHCHRRHHSHTPPLGN